MKYTVKAIPQPGDISEDVRTYQKALNNHGANLKLDGDFGTLTRKAGSVFQKSNGLPGTGVPGERTMELLEITVEKDTEITGTDPDEGTPPWYRRAFYKCEIDPGMESAVKSDLTLIDRHLSRYVNVATRLGFTQEYAMVFAYILGVIHYRESGCNFNGVLHNGEQIVGKNKKTSIVPIGRGPFNSWEDSAVDAINLMGAKWQKLREGSTDIGDILYAIERFNGTGYISGAGKSETSPYLWARSTINDGFGRYVADGKFDPKSSTSGQSGAALLLKEFYRAGSFKCTGVVDAPVIPLPDLSPSPVSNLKIDRETIAKQIVAIIERDVAAELRETHGKNRSPRIDSFNKRAKSYLGAPYCASGGWCAVDDACIKLGLKNPVPPTASSQAFRKTSFVPKKYIRAEGKLGHIGDAAVLQTVGNAEKGHYATLRETQTSVPFFKTSEYNTDGSGTRDGDGAYNMVRSTVDRSAANAGKIFVCFVDIPQWILDHNS